MTALSRRDFLAAGASGAAVALAGCNALGDEAAENEHDAPVTVLTRPDQSDALQLQREFQVTRQEINQRVQTGELNQTEARRELQSAQEDVQSNMQDLRADAVGTVEEHVAETEELTVEDTLPEAGALLVEGDSDAALELLELDPVSGILPEDDFEDYRDQQGLGVQ